MNCSVGILYSARMFLENIRNKPILAGEFRDAFRTYGLSDTRVVLDICQLCNWIRIVEDGYCWITDRGVLIVDERLPELCLRRQLKDIIEVDQPSWIHKMRSGRSELREFLPDGIRQVFHEAGLFNPWNDDLISWWDDLSMTAFSAKSIENLKVGREAEGRTIWYERNRTKADPTWLSLESNHVGYDVLSRISDTDSGKLLIEVKGTKQKLKEASFYLTRHEWEIAKQEMNYVVYLWVLRDPMMLLPVAFVDICRHVPVDQGDGNWINVRIPFKSFQGNKIHVSL